MTYEGRVSGPSRDRPVRVDDFGAERKGALTGPRARTRRIEDGNHALIGANVAVEHIGCVIEESRNGPTRIDGVGPRPLAGARACTRRVEDGETAILGPDETVPHIVRVTAESYDCPKRIDIGGIGALKGPVPAPGASKVVTVCADSGMDIARMTRMTAAGTSWSFVFVK